MDLQRLFHKPKAHSIFFRVLTKLRLYPLSPVVVGKSIGLNKFGLSGYPLSPRNHPLIVGISPCDIFWFIHDLQIKASWVLPGHLAKTSMNYKLLLHISLYVDWVKDFQLTLCEGATICTWEPSIPPNTIGKPPDSKNEFWICCCFVWLGKLCILWQKDHCIWYWGDTSWYWSLRYAKSWCYYGLKWTVARSAIQQRIE